MRERVRFSPAPSGRLHVGGARTALFGWLVAESNGGSFIVRIEDVDPSRSSRRSEASILEDLAWLGLQWEEGPDVGGPHSPYRQSERGALYSGALDRLKEKGSAYPCFCPADALAEQRRLDLSPGVAPCCRGTCRRLTSGEAERRLSGGETAVWRLAVPSAREVTVTDAVHGPTVFSTDTIGDFALTRSDGGALYDLACVVDDAAMSVTLVLRGADHLPDTPRQLLLYDALGLTPPRFAHVPLVMGLDDRPLSESAGGHSIAELREAGYLPEAVIDYLAGLGWSDPEAREQLSREELVRAFDLERVSGSPPKHDPERLASLNARHIRSLPPSRLAEELTGAIGQWPGWLDRESFAAAAIDSLTTLSDASDLFGAVVAPGPPSDVDRDLLMSPEGQAAVSVARDVLRSGSTGSSAVKEIRRRLGDLPARKTLPALRVALTGRSEGLPLGALMELLGTGRALERVERAGVDTAPKGKG